MSWTFEQVAGPFNGATNGPLWDGEAMLFCVPAEHKIMRYHPLTGRVVEYRRFTAGTRAIAFAGEGTLYACQSAARRVARLNRDYTVTMLADRLDGVLHNQPMGLAVDRAGHIWFTDPEPPLRVMEPPIDHASVLRLDRQGDQWTLTRMTQDTLYPTGIVLSPDEKTLFIAENARPGKAGGELRAYPIADDGSLGAPHVIQSFADARLNGMCLDQSGRVILCLEHGERGALVLIGADGVVHDRCEMEHTPTHCAFGGTSGADLYVTCATGKLYRARPQ